LNLTSYKTESLHGEVDCPGDKSVSQRIVIIGSLLNCDMHVNGFLNAQDPISTVNALNSIGSSISINENKVTLKRREVMFKNPEQELNLGNSGTGARLMLGLISGLGLRSSMTGDSSLKKRPMNRVIEPLKMMGAKLSSDTGMLPISTLGSKIINNFEFKMPIASAQVKSCLLLAAMASKKNVKITEPKITRDHTERMIEFFGGEIFYEINQNSKTIQLNYSELEPKNSFDVPGDFSSAAFIIVATIISKDSEVIIKNVGLNDSRKGLLDVLLLMGANLEIKNKKKASNEIVGDIHISSSELRGIEVPDNIIPNIIDEIPILSVAACFAEGKTVIKNAAELRVKESDRLHAVSEGLTRLKIKHEIFEDGISIIGTSKELICDESIDSFDDHRIAMSFLIAGIRSDKCIRVSNCKNIETSFPNFKSIMNTIGMKINEED
jgi:3-phosphoshikimate 1-carboxyvinyltransferase